MIDEIWFNKLLAYNHLIVGYSGGLDSTVLLHYLASHPQAARSVRAVHINHGLSENANAWQQHCQQFCSERGIGLSIYPLKFLSRSNLEEQARIARYDVFSTLVAPNDCLLLAHHANDQAETVLLQLLRGTGVDGLAAMPPIKPFGLGDLVRPLLQHTG